VTVSLLTPHQLGGLAHAAHFGEVFEDRQYLVVRELGVEQRCALELGEPGLAGVSVQELVVALAEVVTDRDVASPPLSIPRTVRLLAAKPGEVVRGHQASWSGQCCGFTSWKASLTIGRLSFNL
jgi:hypothetical protein